METETVEQKVIDEAVLEILRKLGIAPNTEEALGQAVSNLTDVDEEKIKLLSDLQIWEINQLALMLTIAERYDIQWLRTYVDNMLKLRVSVQRLGRREIVKMISGSAEREHAGVRGWLRRRFGKKKEEGLGYATL